MDQNNQNPEPAEEYAGQNLPQAEPLTDSPVKSKSARLSETIDRQMKDKFERSKLTADVAARREKTALGQSDVDEFGEPAEKTEADPQENAVPVDPPSEPSATSPQQKIKQDAVETFEKMTPAEVDQIIKKMATNDSRLCDLLQAHVDILSDIRDVMTSYARGHS